MKIDADDMRDIDRYNPVFDNGYRTYQTLRTRVLAATSHTDIAHVAARVTNFVQDRDVNPVYAESLVTMLMAQGYKVLNNLGEDDVVYNTMAVRRVARHVSTTVSVWQRTMEHNASGTEE